MPSLSESALRAGLTAQTKASQPPVLLTLLVPLVMLLLPDGPAKEPTTATISLELTAMSQPTSRALLPVTSSQDHPPVDVRPPITTSASSEEIHELLVPVIDLVPPLKVPSRKND